MTLDNDSPGSGQPITLIAPIIKLICAYDSTEWEIFAREWATGLAHRYVEVKRMGKTADLGRDVVGFADTQKFEGVWDNYQCKHYAGLLDTFVAAGDIAKIIFYSFTKRYKPPRRSFFVTPRGPKTHLRDRLGTPSLMRQYIVDNWDSACAKAITSTEVIGLLP